MPMILSQVLAATLSVLLVGLPVWVNHGELLGVAKATGRAEINGMPLAAESNVYSGDWIGTEQESTVTLFVTRQERIHFAPKSRARLLKEGNSKVIALDQGTVAFRSVGDIRAAIEKLDVEIRTAGDRTVIGQVTLLNPTQAQVSARRGSLQISAPGQSVVLQPGQSAMITAGTPQHPENGGGARLTKEQKIAVDILIVVGVAAAIAIPLIIRDEDAGAVSPSAPSATVNR